MSEKPWLTTKPPNEVVVEVRVNEKETLRAMAFYGRDGHLPHWRSEDGDRLWEAAAFWQWRPL